MGRRLQSSHLWSATSLSVESAIKRTDASRLRQTAHNLTSLTTNYGGVFTLALMLRETCDACAIAKLVKSWEFYKSHADSRVIVITKQWKYLCVNLTINFKSFLVGRYESYFLRIFKNYRHFYTFSSCQHVPRMTCDWINLNWLATHAPMFELFF